MPVAYWERCGIGSYGAQPHFSSEMRWGIPGVSTSRSPQWKKCMHFLKCWLQCTCTRLSGRQESNPGTAIHLSQLLLLKSDTIRIRDGIEERAMGSMDLPLPINPVLSNLAVADCCCTIIHSVPPVPRTSRCQSKIKQNQSKYSFSALTINMERYQGCKEMWIKTASLAFFLQIISWSKVF